jgi:signal transduction histidine kinase
MLRELIGNSIRSLIKVQPADPTLTITATAADGMIDLEIIDNAGALSAELAAQLGDIAIVSNPENGSGLGAALARQIAERLGGQLTWSADPGVATTATLTLPSAM